MKFTSINSTELPEIDISVKECINAGLWFLFKARTCNTQACFFLKADKSLYALSERGDILDVNPIDKIEMNEFIYFEDLPKPMSLSNEFSLR